jgi:hypothetical protein
LLLISSKAEMRWRRIPPGTGGKPPIVTAAIAGEAMIAKWR